MKKKIVNSYLKYLIRTHLRNFLTLIVQGDSWMSLRSESLFRKLKTNRKPETTKNESTDTNPYMRVLIKAPALDIIS